jgi:hypothetical protein
MDDWCPLKEDTQAESVALVVARAHWRIFLPVAMSILSAFLVALEERQLPTLRGMGTGWEEPAKVVNSLVNGPGFYLGGLIPLLLAGLSQRLAYDAGRVLGITLFWFLVGLSIDRRRNRRALDQQHPIRAGVLFTFGGLVFGFFGLGLGIVDFRDPTSWRLIAEHPLRTSRTMELGFVVWALVFCVYFLRRAFIAARRSLTIEA